MWNRLENALLIVASYATIANYPQQKHHHIFPTTTLQQTSCIRKAYQLLPSNNLKTPV